MNTRMRQLLLLLLPAPTCVTSFLGATMHDCHAGKLLRTPAGQGSLFTGELGA
jgi:hypothetical protein